MAEHFISDADAREVETHRAIMKRLDGRAQEVRNLCAHIRKMHARHARLKRLLDGVLFVAVGEAVAVVMLGLHWWLE